MAEKIIKEFSQQAIGDFIISEATSKLPGKLYEWTEHILKDVDNYNEKATDEEINLLVAQAERTEKCKRIFLRDDVSNIKKRKKTEKLFAKKITPRQFRILKINLNIEKWTSTIFEDPVKMTIFLHLVPKEFLNKILSLTSRHLLDVFAGVSQQGLNKTLPEKVAKFIEKIREQNIDSRITKTQYPPHLVHFFCNGSSDWFLAPGHSLFMVSVCDRRLTLRPLAKSAQKGARRSTS